MKNTFFILFQKIAPQHLLTRFVGLFASCEVQWLKNALIKQFIKAFDIDMSEAKNPDPTSYKSFNDFFVRELHNTAREIDTAPNTIVSPADGAISQLGKINNDKIFQAKHHWFTTTELLGGDEKSAQAFENGEFATIYLSPRDYHRVHMPITGTLRKMHYIPGDLFSVNGATTQAIPGLFARNERIAAIYDTEIGPVAVVMVGAMIVGSIETVWAGQVTPASNNVSTFLYNETQDIILQKGDEMGRFKLGSTAVILFGENSIEWDNDLEADTVVSMGETIGTFKK